MEGDRRERIRVLFIVYRAEWWGCLDSLCRAECGDEDTLCYVMAVPRYERDEGTLEVNFARKRTAPQGWVERLPREAVVVDCESFDLNQGFDRIYIHNPYDNGCYLDSVEETYYSYNLKKYTEKLIYVPHLLYLGGIPEEYAHCPAYANVDAIYLPDGRAKYSLEVQYDEKVEVVPSGIPEYLDRLAEERGGCREGKKKLLYCLSFHNLYYGTERQIQKMWMLFTYFKEHRDVQLIFRPDRDIKMQYGRLQENVRAEYEKLLTYFHKHKIGILDGSPDSYRAAVEADGIISMGHPMNTFFSVLGKYVLQLDWEQREVPSEEDRRIPILWAVEAEECEGGIEIWFVPQGTRLICRMVIPERGDKREKDGKVIMERVSANDRRKGSTACRERAAAVGSKEDGSVEIVAEVPDDVLGGLNYISLIKKGNSLYLSPYSSEGIWKYDLTTGDFREQYLPGDIANRFTATVPYQGALYLIPRFYPGIVRYDMATEELRIIDGWVEEAERHVPEDCSKEPYFIWAVRQEGNMLYMASSKCDVWMEFDMDTDSWEVRHMNLPGKRFVGMVKDGDLVWLFPYCGEEVILWNRESGESRVIHRTVKRETKNSPYVNGIDLRDRIVAFPQQWTDHFLVMRKPAAPEPKGRLEEDGSRDGEKPVCGILEEVREERALPCGEKAYPTEYLRQRKGGYQYTKRLESGRILTYEYYDGAFLLLDRNLKLLRKIPCRLPIEAVRQQQDVIWKKGQCSGDFHGCISEGYSIPAMVEYFVRHGDEDRKEIREHYAREILKAQQYNKHRSGM